MHVANQTVEPAIACFCPFGNLPAQHINREVQIATVHAGRIQNLKHKAGGNWCQLALSFKFVWGYFVVVDIWG